MTRSQLTLLTILIVVMLIGASIFVYYATRPLTISGVVDHQSIGTGTSNGQSTIWYTVSIRLDNNDPVSGASRGDTLGYIVSRQDWDEVWPGDRVEATVTSSAEAKISRVIRQPNELLISVEYENGSAVPNALVWIVNQHWLTEKNETRSSMTDSDGRAVFSSLMPDDYTVYAYNNAYSGTVYELHPAILTVDSDGRWVFRDQWLVVTIKNAQ